MWGRERCEIVSLALDSVEIGRRIEIASYAMIANRKRLWAVRNETNKEGNRDYTKCFDCSTDVTASATFDADVEMTTNQNY